MIKFQPGLNETDPGLIFLSCNHSLYSARILLFGHAENSARLKVFHAIMPLVQTIREKDTI